MAKTFMEMVREAQSAVEAIEPEDLKAKLDRGEEVLVIDVRDVIDIVEGGSIPGAVAISLGTLGYKADPSMPEGMRHEALGDFDQQIATTCFVGAISSMGAKLLQDLGYTNVTYVKGGTSGWSSAGFDIADFEE